LTEQDLVPVNSWVEAVEKSKGYNELELVGHIIKQFESQLENRPFISKD